MLRRRICAACALLSSIYTIVGAQNCGDVWIKSQDDADKLGADCETVAGNVQLAMDWPADINLDGVKTIDGNLLNWQNAPLSSLSSSTLESISGNFTLTSADDLTTVSFPALTSIKGELHLERLNSLRNLTIPKVKSVGALFLRYAKTLTSIDLDTLETVEGFDGQNASIVIRDTNLKFLSGLDITSDLDYLRISDNDFMEQLNFTIHKISSIQILRNGNATTAVTPLVNDDQATVDVLDVADCGKFSFDKNGVQGLNVGYAVFTYSTFTDLDLSEFSLGRGLALRNNTNLTLLSLPDPMPTSLDRFEIVNNERLDSANITTGWPWSITNVSSMSFTGGPFHSEFFQTSDAGTLANRTLVDGSFEVDSTDGSFDCSYLNSLRSDGVLSGEYECQGSTVDEPDDSAASFLFRNPGLAALAAVAAALWMM